MKHPLLNDQSNPFSWSQSQNKRFRFVLPLARVMLLATMLVVLLIGSFSLTEGQGLPSEQPLAPDASDEPRSLVGINLVGVIPGPGGCPSGIEAVTITHLPEHGTSLTGWTGAVKKVYGEDYLKLHWTFCLVDGSLFKPLHVDGDTYFSYALYRPYGESCPPGSYAVDRYFDGEDGWGNHKILRNITLSFCFYPPSGELYPTDAMYEFPELSFEYGIFTDTPFDSYVLETGIVYSDDENENNNNYYRPGSHSGYSAPSPLTAYDRTKFHEIVGGQDDTYLRLAQVNKPPTDARPDLCNGHSYCAANPRKIDLTVSLYRDVIATEQISYTNIFLHFADAIYEMTEGVHRVRRVDVCDNGTAQTAANIQWTAATHPNADLSGYFRESKQIRMADVFVSGTVTIANFLDANRWVDAGYTLGHEWGHYYYGLKDEYEGDSTCNLASNPNWPSPCLGDVAVPNSVMNDQWAAGPPTPDLNFLNFSIGASQTFSNTQYRVYGASGWETLARSPNQDPRHASLTDDKRRRHFPELGIVVPMSPTLPPIQLNVAGGPDNARAFLKVNWNPAICNDLVTTKLTAGNVSSAAASNPISIPVEAGVDAFDLIVDHDAPMASPVKVVVRDPSDQVVVDQDCTATDHVPNRCTASVLAPAPGVWTANIVVDNPPAAVVYEAIAYHQAPGPAPIQAGVSVLPDDVVFYPQPALIVARLWQDLPIARATLTASLEQPDGTIVPLTLRDDGQAPDHMADDGDYSGFMPYTQTGPHWIEMRFTNDQGTAVYSDLGLEDSTRQITPVGYDFQRVVEATVVISGVVSDDHGNTPALATPLNLDNSDTPGRIDYAGDIDVLTVEAGTDQSVVARVAELGQGMLPRVRILGSDGSTVLHEVLYTLGDHAYPFATLDLKENQPIYIEVSHQDPKAEQGFYFVSAGTTLGGDKPPTTTPNPTPGNFVLTVDGGSTNMELSWTVTNDVNVTHYRVLRAPGSGQSFQPIAENITDTVYYDGDAALTVGTEYCYRVEALRGDNSLSATSNDDCGRFGLLELWAPDRVGAPGEQVIVPINVRNADGLRIAASDVWMDFDPRVIESISISRTSLTEDYAWAHSVQTIDSDTHRVRIAYIHSNLNELPPEIHGDGSLFWLTFAVKGQPGETSPLNLNEFIQGVGGSSIQQEELKDVKLVLDDGIFTVKDGNNASYILGDVDADGVVRALDAALALRIANGARTPTSLELLAGDINGNGSIEEADATMILYYAGNAQWPPVGGTARRAEAADARTASIHVDALSGTPGATMQTTLRADNLFRMAGGNFVLLYDADVVQRVVDVQATGLAAGFAQVHFQDQGNGLLSISLADDAEINGSGALLTISLQIAADAAPGASPLRLAQAKLNDLNGRNFVTGYADHTLTRQSATITVTEDTTQKLYLPAVQR